MNRMLKSILRTAMYVMDQIDNASDLRDRAGRFSDQVSDRFSDMADTGRRVIYGEDHTLRNIGIFAAGFGVGIGAGLLLAPASGTETRDNIRDRVQDIGERVRDRISPGVKARASGTEGGI
jgi:YtxH-like protein